MTAAPRLARLALALPSVVFVLLLGAAEVGIRTALPRVRPLDLLVDDPHHRDHLEDGRAVSIFEADPLLFWRLAPHLRDVIWDFTLVSTNAQGLRHPTPVTDPAEAPVRVVALGDSVTFGYRVPVVWPDRPDAYSRRDQPYPRLLEELLDGDGPARHEVIAIAVPGYSSHQGRAWLEREIAALQPRLVTACFGWNDVSLRAASDRASMPTARHRVLARALAMRSQALMRLALALRRRTATPRPPVHAWVPRVSREEFVDNHLAIARLAARHGARTLVIGPVFGDPTAFPDVAERLAGHRLALATALRGAGIPYLEVPELLETAHPATLELFGEAIHPNAIGHRVLARAVHGAIRERGLLAARGPTAGYTSSTPPP